MEHPKSGPYHLAFLFLSSFLIMALPLSAIEITNDFEGMNPLQGFTVDGWGIRAVDTCQWGPQTAPSGTHAVGVPEVCQSGYPNGNPGQLWEGTLTTPTISTTQFPSMYLGFTYWADFEGVTDTFDGVILEFINLTQGRTTQIDSAHVNELCPSYDAIIGTTNPRLRGLWAYCFDTLAPRFNSLGYPFVVLQRIRPGEEVPSRGPKQPNMPTAFEWRSVVSVDLIAAGYANPGDNIQIRWVFASDQLANGQGYFFDDLFISSDPPDDNQPPGITVTSPVMWADIPDSNQAITVSADLTEGCGGSGVNPDSVFLVWELERVPQTNIPMTNTGGDTYEGDLPGQPYDTDIRYRVRATDNAGNTGSSPWRHLEVTDAITLSYDDGIPASVFTGLEAEDGFTARYVSPVDTMYLLHKIMYYTANDSALFHVTVNRDGPQGTPGTEIYRDTNITNGLDANTFFQYEFPETDSVIINPNTAFHVGMRLASSDSLLDPQQLSDGSDEFQGESWVIVGGGAQEITSEVMIRCKVKKLVEPPIGVGDESGGTLLPRVYALGQNFPNPFNPSTTIRFAIPIQGGEKVSVETRLSIYTIRGQLIRTLVDEEKVPGEYTIQWDGKNEQGETAGSGIYIYRLQAGDFSSTKKMVVVK